MKYSLLSLGDAFAGGFWADVDLNTQALPTHCVLLATKADGLITDLVKFAGEIDELSGDLMHLLIPRLILSGRPVRHPEGYSEMEENLAAHPEQLWRVDATGEILGSETIDDFVERYEMEALDVAKRLNVAPNVLPVLYFAPSRGSSIREPVVLRLKGGRATDVVKAIRQVATELRELSEESARRRRDWQTFMRLDREVRDCSSKLEKSRKRQSELEAIPDPTDEKRRKALRTQEWNTTQAAKLRVLDAQRDEAKESFDSQSAKWYADSRAGSMGAVQRAKRIHAWRQIVPDGPADLWEVAKGLGVKVAGTLVGISILS